MMVYNLYDKQMQVRFKVFFRNNYNTFMY